MRRAIWSLLLQAKQTRTVIMTTHVRSRLLFSCYLNSTDIFVESIEEAQCLATKIAVLACGELKYTSLS